MTSWTLTGHARKGYRFVCVFWPVFGCWIVSHGDQMLCARCYIFLDTVHELFLYRKATRKFFPRIVQMLFLEWGD